MKTAGDIHAAWRDLPLGSLDDIVGPGRCVVLAPHPDDESLGCGGFIAACVDAGRPPLVAILTDGTGSHPNSREYPHDRLRAVRQQEARCAIRHLGLPDSHLIFLGQPDTSAPHAGPAFDAVVQALRGHVDAGTTILAPWRHDPHCDHEAASLIAGAVGVRHLAYPVWGWTLPPGTPVRDRAQAGWRLDVGRHLGAKRRAILSHRSQYGGLITDDPTGFQLPPALLETFDTPYETFLLT